MEQFRNIFESDLSLRNWLKNRGAENTNDGWTLSNDVIRVDNYLKDFIAKNDKGKFKNSSIDEIIFKTSNGTKIIKVK